MLSSEVDDVLQRLRRLIARTDEKDGTTMEWSVKTESGITERVTVSGVKDFQRLVDEVTTALVFVPAVKDRLVRQLVAQGRTKKAVEAEVDDDACLAICIDLANHAKHGGDYEWGSRSLKRPRLGEPTAHVPQRAVGSLTVGADFSHTAVAKPEQVDFTLPVLDADGRTIGEALTILRTAVEKLERMSAKASAER